MSLLVDAVTVRFGGLTAVQDLTLEVPDAGLAGLIGPNGAGKTTIFNAISGFLQPSSGRILFDGRDLAGVGSSGRARLGIGRTFQKLELFGRMSAFDNVLVAAEAAGSRVGLLADLLRLPRRAAEERRCGELADGMLEMLGIAWARDRRAADLPVGTARILELARALCIAPRLLLLDEPSSGLDPAETRAFGELLVRINEDMGIAVLLVEHDMDLVLDVCREIYVLDFGRLVASGSPAEIVAHPDVRSAYLGEEVIDGAAPAPPQP